MAYRLSIINTTGPTEVAGRNIPDGAIPLLQEAFGDVDTYLTWVAETSRDHVRATVVTASGDVAAIKAAADAVELARTVKGDQVDTDWPV